MPFQLEAIYKAFDGKPVLEHISLTLPKNGIFLLRGASGCGKTTLLRILAGLEQPDSGRRIGFAGKRISMLFQEPRLLPQSTALENVSLVCGEEQARRWLCSVGLDGELLQKPHQLSGGQKQRVAIARALAYPSDLLLLDEPFTGLDLQLRSEILRLIQLYAKESPAVLVSHEEIGDWPIGGEYNLI